MAAVNAAFIVSNAFGENLIVGVFSLWPSKVNKAFSDADETQKSISYYLDAEPQKLQRFFKEDGKIRKELVSLQQEYLEVKKGLNHHKFNYVSTCAFFYSLAVIILIGLDIDLSPYCNCVMYSNYVSLFILLLYVLLPKEKSYSPNHFKCLGIVILVIGISVIIEVFACKVYGCCTPCDNNDWWSLFRVKLSLVIWPLIHFGLMIAEVRIKVISKLPKIYNDLDTKVLKPSTALENKIIGAYNPPASSQSNSANNSPQSNQGNQQNLTPPPNQANQTGSSGSANQPGQNRPGRGGGGNSRINKNKNKNKNKNGGTT